MPQSFSNNFVHIVFSTKHREPFLHDGIRDRMFAYMGGICNELESTPIIIGGSYEHFHILCNLSRKIAMMKLVEEVKSHSSYWIKNQDEKCFNFYWQNGYAGFSVDKLRLHQVIGYIENQQAHHAKKENFKVEYTYLLDIHGQEYDERYMWD